MPLGWWCPDWPLIGTLPHWSLWSNVGTWRLSTSGPWLVLLFWRKLSHTLRLFPHYRILTFLEQVITLILGWGQADHRPGLNQNCAGNVVLQFLCRLFGCFYCVASELGMYRIRRMSNWLLLQTLLLLLAVSVLKGNFVCKPNYCLTLDDWLCCMPFLPVHHFDTYVSWTCWKQLANRSHEVGISENWT